VTIHDIYDLAPAYFWVGALILGFLVGSFLNVVIYRLPKMMMKAWADECKEYLLHERPENECSDNKPQAKAEPFNLAFPNSHCPACNAQIKPWQNIPVVSYLMLRGACANCGITISIRYPSIEFATGLITLFAVWFFGASMQAVFAVIFVWCLICLTMIDIDHQLLPDSITLPLLWIGLIANINGLFTSLESAVIGAVSGYLFLWGVYWLFKLVTGKEGMGYGDFKLLAAFGAWMGWQYLPLIIILSSLVGAVLGIVAIVVNGRDKAKPMPFGPYLAGAGLIALFWGDVLLRKYIQFAAPTT
jgi:leader peptidase (prepilin peptidase) / N-methyltransferase